MATETEPVKYRGDGGNPGGDDTGGVGLPVEDGVGDGLPSGGVGGGGNGLPVEGGGDVLPEEVGDVLPEEVGNGLPGEVVALFWI